MKRKMILADNYYRSMDCYETKVNNNVLVVGAAGSGKTRSIVEPNILQAEGSYIISDPKGSLYKKYKDYLEEKGYKVRVLDLVDPVNSNKYNPIEYLESDRDVMKLAHIFCQVSGGRCLQDPFWDESSELLLSSLLAYVKDFPRKADRVFQSIIKLALECQIDEDSSSRKTVLDSIMEKDRSGKSFALKQYRKFRIGAGKTLKSVLITLNTRFKDYDNEEINSLMSKDEMKIEDIGKEKTALFVIVSDMDRSLDSLANMFYSQALDVLCRYADRETLDHRLPVSVRFILDDFATNCVITDFPKKISAFRSRGISSMIMLQSEGQLEACYPREGNIIISNCDNYVYLGGNDIASAESIARRCDVPVKNVLNMPLETCWVIRRGEEPVKRRIFDLDSYDRLVKEIENVKLR